MDKKKEQAVKELAGKLLHKYYEEKDINFVLSVMDADIIWVGSEKDMCARSIEEMRDRLEDFEGKVPVCRIREEAYQTVELSDDVCLCISVYRTEAADTTGRMSCPWQQKLTSVFRCRGDALSCVSVHWSHSCGILDSDVPEGNYFTCDNRAKYDRQLKIILKAIKGGLKVSRADEDLTLLYVSDEVCRMLGYTQKEFLEMCGGSTVGAVWEPDAGRFVKECRDFLQSGATEYTMKYRMRCKDGTIKWILDSGRKMADDSGQSILSSLNLDVTNIEKANEENEKQKLLLDSIYHTMMCGIIRCSFRKEGLQILSFNREAMRILGNPSWKEGGRLTWNEIGPLVHKEDRDRFLLKTAGLLEDKDSFTDEFRITVPDGASRWVYLKAELLEDAGEKSVVQTVMLDITERKQLELKLEEERQRFRIAIENTAAVVFEYDLKTDTYRSFGTLEEGRGKKNLENELAGFMAGHIDSLVEPSYKAAFLRVLSGRTTEEELKMALYPGKRESVWVHITTTPIMDDNGEMLRLIGKMMNIQSEKEKEFALEEAKARDGLTGLYSKEAGIKKVKEYMESRDPREVCAMMLLDMDDFRKINEAEGSVFADAILQETAAILYAETDSEDIRIRLGGDEFMLFVKNCDKAGATILGPRIAEKVKELFRPEGKDIHISVSIGMCVTAVADEYSGLYRCAESTLKYVKSNGKGKAACYLDTSNELGTVLTRLYKGRHIINEINGKKDIVEADLTSFALELLGKAKKLEDAVYLLLTRIGKSFQLDRVSILEMNYDYMSCRFTFQWTADKAKLAMNRTFYLSGEEFEALSGQYDEEGLSEELLGSSENRACSMLHTAFFNEGIYAGSLIFEKKEKGYVWSKEQKKVIKELSRIIFSFVMKARADAVSQAKTDFLSRMSHEIRTPMNAITGMTAIAKTVLGDREKTLDCLNKIESANAYLLDFINDILDMSRIESGKIELNIAGADLKRQIRNVETMLRSQAEGKDIRFTVEYLYEENHPVLADTMRLNQILINIIGNAIKFTGKGGAITVCVKPEAVKAGGVRLHFSVKDTGIGISREAEKRIFSAFEQAGANTASEYGGTGLGLAISSRLVQMMGGSLKVESQPGKGSEFYFTLDFAYAEKPEGKEETAGKKDYDFSGKCVLLAEDNEINREIAVTLLQMKGIRVETAANGREALKQFAEHAPFYYDAVLMDIRMPEMDGLEATKRLRTMGKKDSGTIPVIAMTANAFDEDTKKSLESGMNGHLSKPIEPELLFQALGEAMK